MKWLDKIIAKWGKEKKTRVYKAEALPDGQSRDIMLVKESSADGLPVNVAGHTAVEMLDHQRMYGTVERLDAAYTEPSPSAEKLCAGCMFFLRNPWSMSDSCQLIDGNIQWYGTCKLRIDANEQAKIVYAHEIGEYAEKAKAPAPVEQPEGETTVSRSVAIVKTETEQRLVFGVVYAPDVLDAHGDFMTATEIEKACNLYGATMQVVNKQHGEDVAVDVVQNYIAPADFVADNGVTIKKGTWLQVMKVHDDDLWAKIKSGEMTGYSFEGYAVRTPVAE